MMNFNHFIQTILGSDPQDWTRVDNPTFLQSIGEVHQFFPPVDGPRQGENDRRWIELKEHDHLLTYKRNMSFAMAKGMPYRETFSEPWTEGFLDKHAWSIYVDLLWNGMPVHREIGVVVDGGRCTLPLPLPGTTEVPQGKFDLFGLIHELVGGGDDYHDYCRRAGLTPIQYVWPK